MTTSSTGSPLTVRGPSVPREDEILTPEALDVRRRAAAAVRRQARRAARPTAGAPRRDRAHRPPGLPARDTGDPRRRLDTSRRRRPTSSTAGSRSPGPTEPQDGDQRAELRRQGVAGRPRGRQHPALGATSSAARSTCTTPSAGTLTFTSPEGKEYRLRDRTARSPSIVVRPRGWHLDERHLLVDGEPAVGALVDFGLYFFHNAAELLDRGSGPYFYLPKMESHLEARLWNDVFTFAEERARHPARHDPRDRPDRDHPGRVRDGRDPLRAARPRLRAQRRPLGLPVQHHQVLPRRRPGVRPARTAAP